MRSVRRHTSIYEAALWAAVGTFLFVACESGVQYAPPKSTASTPGGPVTTPTGQAGNGGALPVGDGDGDGDGEPVIDPFANAGGAATGPEIPELGDPLCDMSATWGMGEALMELNTPGDELLLDITPDERTIAFLRDGAPMIAERADPEGAWGVATALVLPAGYDPSLGLALENSALGMIAVQENGAGFGRLTRESRGEAFGDVVDESLFTVLNNTAAMTMMTLSSPVIADNGAEIWWVEHWSESAIYSSPYNTVVPLTRSHVGCDDRGACNLLLDGVEGTENLITGLSADRRTVFMDFEIGGVEMLTRDGVELKSPFFDSVALAGREAPQTNTNCSALYYTSAGDLFVDHSL